MSRDRYFNLLGYYITTTFSSRVEHFFDCVEASPSANGGFNQRPEEAVLAVDHHRLGKNCGKPVAPKTPPKRGLIS